METSFNYILKKKKQKPLQNKMNAEFNSNTNSISQADNTIRNVKMELRKE